MSREERERWMSAVAEAVVLGGLSTSQEACVLAGVNGYCGDKDVLDETYYQKRIRECIKAYIPESTP